MPNITPRAYMSKSINKQDFHFFGLIYKGTEKGAVYVESIVIETY